MAKVRLLSSTAACAGARRAAAAVAGPFRLPAHVAMAQFPQCPARCARSRAAIVWPARRTHSTRPAAAEGASGRLPPPHETAPGTAAGQTAADVESDVQEVLELLDEKKAMDVVVLRASEIEKMRVLCDCMVVLSCTSRRHMKIVADHVVDHFRLKGMLVEQEDEHGKVRRLPPSIEDPQSDEWMLVDLQHIIVQIFSREGREKVRIISTCVGVRSLRAKEKVLTGGTLTENSMSWRRTGARCLTMPWRRKRPLTTSIRHEVVTQKCAAEATAEGRREATPNAGVFFSSPYSQDPGVDLGGHAAGLSMAQDLFFAEYMFQQLLHASQCRLRNSFEMFWFATSLRAPSRERERAEPVAARGHVITVFDMLT